jgi:hypothetical protein
MDLNMSDSDFLKKCDQLLSSLESLPSQSSANSFSDKIYSIYDKLDFLKKSLEYMDMVKEESGWSRVPNKMMWTHPEHGHLEVNRKEGKVNVIHTTPTGSRTNWGSWNDGPNIAATAAEMTRRKMSEGGMLSGQPNIKKSDYGKFKGGSAYSAADNARRKAANTGEVAEGSGKNVNVKAYSSKTGQLSAKQSAAVESQKYKQMNRKQPVKTFSPEEIEAVNQQRKKLAASIDIDAEYSEKIVKKETEMANNLAHLLKLNSSVSSQPVGNWIQEASKPISNKFSSEEEEMAYWRSIKVSDKDDGGYGY